MAGAQVEGSPLVLSGATCLNKPSLREPATSTFGSLADVLTLQYTVYVCVQLWSYLKGTAWTEWFGRNGMERMETAEEEEDRQMDTKVMLSSSSVAAEESPARTLASVHCN